MLKELQKKCAKQMDEHDSCYGCPHEDQCAAFREFRWLVFERVVADIDPWQLSDHYVERFDELIAKLGGEQ